MDTKKYNLPTIIAVVTLVFSISGWAIKTTVSNMILESSNSDLKTKVVSLTEDLRWCRIYSGSVLPMIGSEEVIPSYLIRDANPEG